MHVIVKKNIWKVVAKLPQIIQIMSVKQFHFKTDLMDAKIKK